MMSIALYYYRSYQFYCFVTMQNVEMQKFLHFVFILMGYVEFLQTALALMRKMWKISTVCFDIMLNFIIYVDMHKIHLTPICILLYFHWYLVQSIFPLLYMDSTYLVHGDKMINLASRRAICICGATPFAFDQIKFVLYAFFENVYILAFRKHSYLICESKVGSYKYYRDD